MIFVLKRDVLNQCYLKYLDIRGRLPKNPITSITDLLTNTQYVYRMLEYQINSAQQFPLAMYNSHFDNEVHIGYPRTSTIILYLIQILRFFFPPSYVVTKLTYSHRFLMSKRP